MYRTVFDRIVDTVAACLVCEHYRFDCSNFETDTVECPEHKASILYLSLSLGMRSGTNIGTSEMIPLLAPTSHVLQ